MLDDERLIADLEPVISSVVRHFRSSPGLSYADMCQVGRIAVWRARRDYDPSRGASWPTYAYLVVRRDIRRAMEQQSRTIRLPSHIYEDQARVDGAAVAIALDAAPELVRMMADPSPGPAEQVEELIECEELWREVDRLPARWAEVIRLRYGLNDGKGRTLEEVGRHFGVTRERIRQIEAKAVKQLRAAFWRQRGLSPAQAEEAYQVELWAAAQKEHWRDLMRGMESARLAAKERREDAL